MKTSGVKKLAAIVTGAVSAIAITGVLNKMKQGSVQCSCGDADCGCEDNRADLIDVTDIYIPEPSVRKTSVIKRPRTAGAGVADPTDAKRTVRVLQEMFEDIKDKTIPNDSIAKIIMSLINLQNVINPKRAIDVRNIHFMTNGKQNTMVIELFTANYSHPEYEEELSRLWSDVFLAEDFWNADFIKVRVNTKDRESEEALEAISCGLEDVRQYLMEEISMDEFKGRWTRKRPNSGPKTNGKSKASTSEKKQKTSNKLKRA